MFTIFKCMNEQLSTNNLQNLRHSQSRMTAYSAHNHKTAVTVCRQCRMMSDLLGGSHAATDDGTPVSADIHVAHFSKHA